MSANEERKVLRSTDDTNRQTLTSTTRRQQQARTNTSRQVRTKDKSIECKLSAENENDLDEENLILENVDLTDDDLKLKAENKDLFWQKIAEKIRSNLSETLEENQQLHEFKKALEQDNRDLAKEQTKLAKLANEAGEICKSFLNQDDVDDSGIND